MLDKSTIVGSILGGQLDLNTDEYEINGVFRDWLYFLVDGIYPKWAIFINTYKHPVSEKERAFASKQESVRKDVERAFGVLVQQWGILANPLRNWEISDIQDILDCCIIMHNMVTEHRRSDYKVSDWMDRDTDVGRAVSANDARVSLWACRARFAHTSTG
jgi:Plant transposon protein